MISKKKIFLFAASLSLALTACNDKEEKMSDPSVYIGTYTRAEGHVDGKAEGIIKVEINKKNGALSSPVTVAKIINPSFINKSSDGKYLFAVSELGPGDDKHGEVFSYEILENDSLKLIDVASTDAHAPCYVVSDSLGKHIFIANYLDGVAKMIKVDNGKFVKSDTIILKGGSVHPQQFGALLHHITFSKDEKKIYITDKGSDKIWLIDIDHENTKFLRESISSVSIQAGAGPRHLEFTSDYKYAYTMNELDNMINCFSVQNDGRLVRVGKISALPFDFKGESYGAEIKILNSDYVYVSNRGHNSIAAFKINKDNGHLSLVDYYPSKGHYPRSFEIDPEGKFLYVANQNSNNIIQFSINHKSGELSLTENELKVGTPVDIQF